MTLDARLRVAPRKPIVPQAMFDEAQKLLEANSEKRPTGKPFPSHVYLLEGLVRCGACGSMMTRASGGGRNETFYYYRCTRKHRTANTACDTRDVPADKLERFVIEILRSRSIDIDTVRAAVREANGGRDEALAAIEAEVGEKRAAHLQAAKALAKVVDAIDQDGADVKTLVGRMREREKLVDQLRQEVVALEAKAEGLREESLDAKVVAEAYLGLPAVLDRLEREGLREELRALLQGVIDVIEWRQGPRDPKSGEALVALYPLPGVNGDDVGSSTRQGWLAGEDLKPRPAD